MRTVLKDLSDLRNFVNRQLGAVALPRAEQVAAPVAAAADLILTTGTLSSDVPDATIAAEAQPDVPRNLTVFFALNYDGPDVVVTGLDQFGNAVSETFTAGSNVTRTGTKIFDSVSNISNDGVAGVGAASGTVGVGDKLGVTLRFEDDDAQVLFADGVAEAGTFDATYKAVTPTTVPDAAVNYIVQANVKASTVQSVPDVNATL